MSFIFRQFLAPTSDDDGVHVQLRFIEAELPCFFQKKELENSKLYLLSSPLSCSGLISKAKILDARSAGVAPKSGNSRSLSVSDCYSKKDQSKQIVPFLTPALIKTCSYSFSQGLFFARIFSCLDLDNLEWTLDSLSQLLTRHSLSLFRNLSYLASKIKIRF